LAFCFQRRATRPSKHLEPNRAPPKTKDGQEFFAQETNILAALCVRHHEHETFPIILSALVLLLVADCVRWKIAVGRELKRRDLVRVRGFSLRPKVIEWLRPALASETEKSI
jgi:hypothetical protein